VVDVASFRVHALAEPEEIVIPDNTGRASSSDSQKPVLVAPAPHTRTTLKTHPLQRQEHLNALLLKLRGRKLNLVRRRVQAFHAVGSRLYKREIRLGQEEASPCFSGC
jgi:hypothetical protein